MATAPMDEADADRVSKLIARAVQAFCTPEEGAVVVAAFLRARQRFAQLEREATERTARIRELEHAAHFGLKYAPTDSTAYVAIRAALSHPTTAAEHYCAPIPKAADLTEHPRLEESERADG